MEAILGATAFVALFLAWVVVPTIIRKRHVDKAKEEGSKQ